MFLYVCFYAQRSVCGSSGAWSSIQTQRRLWRRRRRRRREKDTGAILYGLMSWFWEQRLRNPDSLLHHVFQIKTQNGNVLSTLLVPRSQNPLRMFRGSECEATRLFGRVVVVWLVFLFIIIYEQHLYVGWLYVEYEPVSFLLRAGLNCWVGTVWKAWASSAISQQVWTLTHVLYIWTHTDTHKVVCLLHMHRNNNYAKYHFRKAYPVDAIHLFPWWGCPPPFIR